MMAQAIRRVCGTFSMPSKLRHRPRDARPGVVYGVEQRGRAASMPALQRVGSCINRPLRHGDQPHQVRQVLNRPGQPPAAREPAARRRHLQ